MTDAQATALLDLVRELIDEVAFLASEIERIGTVYVRSQGR